MPRCLSFVCFVCFVVKGISPWRSWRFKMKPRCRAPGIDCQHRIYFSQGLEGATTMVRQGELSTAAAFRPFRGSWALAVTLLLFAHSLEADAQAPAPAP